MWHITPDDAESIAIGAGILGTGGGGNPYLGKLRLLELLKQGRTPVVIDIDEVAPDAAVCDIGSMGAPTVGIEKLPMGLEAVWALEALEGFIGRPIDALLCAEIGGSNSIEPLIAGALTGKPILDADGMGRAFPEMQMSTYMINGVPCVPAAMVDEKGNQIIFSHLTSPFVLERFARDLCVQMGCRAMLALPVMTGEQARAYAVPRTLTLAKRVGEAVRRARRTKESMVEAVLVVTGGYHLFTGKLVDVQRRTTGGFARGEMRIEGLDQYRGGWLHVAFQNENLVAWRGTAETRGEVVTCVPDLICTLETESGEPITTEQLRYGLRVTLLAIPCSDQLRTPQALQVIGPAAFGYPEVVFQPIPKVPGVGIA